MANGLASLQMGMALMGQTPAVVRMAAQATRSVGRPVTRRRRKKKSAARKTRRKKRSAVRARGRLKKGSPAAKRYMARLRKMRKK